MNSRPFWAENRGRKRMFRLSVGLIAAISMALPAIADEDDGKRRIEEVIVTAEKVESTVSDTSISITAIGADMIEDLGIQSADEFVNFIPATTRTTPRLSGLPTTNSRFFPGVFAASASTKTLEAPGKEIASYASLLRTIATTEPAKRSDSSIY